MKKYIKPEIAKECIGDDECMICASPGVQTGDGLGNEYGKDDVSYSKQVNFNDEETIW